MQTLNLKDEEKRARFNIGLRSTPAFILRELKSRQLISPDAHITDGLFQSYVVWRLSTAKSIKAFLNELERDTFALQARRGDMTIVCQKVIMTRRAFEERPELSLPENIDAARLALTVARRITCRCHETGCFTVKR